MEAAGLAIGIVGIAGLFNTCLDSLSRFQSYKSSNADSHILDTRFRAARARFEQWGASVGISQGRLLPDHHPGLNDENTADVIHDILHIIVKTICENGDAQQNLLQNERFAGILQSRRKRLRWALGGKEDRTEQVEIFEKLVQQLHNLVSVDRKGREQSERQTNGGWTDVRQILLNMEQGMKNEMRRDIYSWLGIPSSSDKYQDSLDQRVDNTCSWIFDRQEFETWLSPEDPTSPGLLWINGPAGFGKTILCARIVQHLSKTLATPVAYFFFTPDLGSRDTPYLALRSWIYQVADVQEDAFECVRRAWEAFPTETASRRNLIDLFTDIVATVPGLTFIADGLDECSQLGSDDTSMAQFLSHVIRGTTKSNTRLLFISRDEPGIRDALEENAPELFAEYRIVPDDVRSDTAAFSQSIVDRKLSNKSEDIRMTLSEAMTNRCEGQFLWIRMQEESLRKGMSKKRLHEAVENTPPGLDRLYDHNWKRILAMSQWEQDRVFALLRWAAFARRALSVYEITEAVLITQFEELDPDEYPDEFDNEYIRTEIVGLCGPLLEVKEMFVHIPHFSVRQYLCQHLPLPSWIQQNSQLQDSYERYHNTVIARACLQYLNQPQVWQTRYNWNSTGRSLRWYASGTWVKHVRNASQDASIWELATEMMREDNPFWKPFSEYVAEAMKDQGDKDGDPADNQPLHPLEYALSYEWKDMANHLINESNANRPGPFGRTPLVKACRVNMPETVERLLQAGADLTITYPDKQTPLHMAAWYGIEETVKVLLSHGADLSAQDETGWTPLHAASVRGNLKCCEVLIRSGADLTVKDSKGMNALHLACCETGQTEVARLILQNGPEGMALEQCTVGPPLHFTCATGDIETTKVLLDYGGAASFAVLNKNGATPLMMAAGKGHTELVKLLLNHGADTTLSIAIKDEGWTLLHTLCFRNDSDELIRAILRPGVEDSMLMVDHKGRTPLHIASQYGRINAVNSILGYKHANIRAITEAKNTLLHTPLWLAARNGHAEVVKALLDHGTTETISTIDDRGKTPLWIATRYGHTSVVHELLKQGAGETIAMTSVAGDTPLWLAAYNGHADIVKALFDHGAESTIGVVDYNSETPLHIASREGHLEVVRLLLDHGADSTIECVDVYSETPLYAASDTGRVEIVRELLARGAESTVTTMSEPGNSPLYAACRSGELDVVQQLLDHGAVVTVTVSNKKGNTPLHQALYQGNPEIVRLLLKRGAGSTVRMLDRNGDCPLYVAAGGGDIGIVNQLLEYGAEADITTLTSGGRPPLFAAAESGVLEVFQRLLGIPDAETTLMLLDNFSESILSAASRGGCVQIVQELLDRGVGKHIVVPIKSGETPLSNAAFNGYVEIVRLFLSVPQVPVNHMDNYGVTPLFSAARFGHLETVEVLLSNAAIEVNCENWKCLTPLHAAVANGHVEVAEVLISKGATIVVWPTVGQSLLWWAERTGKLSMVQLLESNGVTQDSLGPFRYFRRDAPPEDAATVVFDRSMGYCDVCTLTVEDDKGHGCDKCCEMFGEEMIICSECLDRGYDVCRNDHTLEKREKLCY